MAECKKAIVSPKDISEYFGSFGEFAKLVKPKMPPFSGLDSKEALTKWLIAQFWVGVIAHTVNFLLTFLNPLAPGTMAFSPLINGLIGAFIGAWFSWFMLIKREPACCCICIFVITGWKQMFLVYGLICMAYGVMWIVLAVLALLSSLTYLATAPLAVVYSAINLVVLGLYGITLFFIGLSATKMGAKEAGVQLPEAVGKAGA